MQWQAFCALFGERLLAERRLVCRQVLTGCCVCEWGGVLIVQIVDIHFFNGCAGARRVGGTILTIENCMCV